MTIDEIFAKLNNRMIEAEMLHSQMAEYWDFFGYLNGFKRWQEYRMMDEIACRRKINRFFINHYNKLIPVMTPEDPAVIPSAFYTMNRGNLNGNSKGYIKTGIEKWYTWEDETENMLDELIKEATELQETRAVTLLGEIAYEVSHEKKMACRLWLKCKSVDYDIAELISMQDCLHDKYKRKLKKAGWIK